MVPVASWKLKLYKPTLFATFLLLNFQNQVVLRDQPGNKNYILFFPQCFLWWTVQPTEYNIFGDSRIFPNVKKKISYTHEFIF